MLQYLNMDQVAQVREKIDIVSLIGEFVTLKRAGKNFKANCPFHGEKTPSFMVSPERQIWHCFGCAKGGDAFTFLMEFEHCDFPEALRILAKRAGIELQQYKGDTGVSSKKEQIYRLNGLAAEFYHFVLTKHPAGEKALAYLEKRGVDSRLLKSFMIGFAPHSRGALARFLMTKKDYKREELFEAGLITYPTGTIQDFFRGRIIFPLFDHRDNAVGFSGRILTDADNGPKYINTKETLVYHKGDLFFGLNITKDAIRRENQAILVEGEFDVLSCFQNGISNVIAVKGTALTEQQVNLISRYAQKVTVCFDGDRAGQEAIKRSLPIIEKKGLATTVIVIPGGKDPDESLKNDPVAFKKAVKQESNVYDYLFSQALSAFDKQTAEGKRQIADALLPTLSSIENAIIKEHYIKKLSNELDTTYESISKELLRLKRKEPVMQVKPTAVVKKSREEILEEYLLSLLLQSQNPKTALDSTVAVLEETMTNERAQQKIIHHLSLYFEKEQEFTSKQFGDGLPKELTSVFDTCLLFPLPHFTDAASQLQEIKKVADQLHNIYLHSRLKALGAEIKMKDESATDEELQALNENFTRLSGKLQKG